MKIIVHGGATQNAVKAQELREKLVETEIALDFANAAIDLRDRDSKRLRKELGKLAKDVQRLREYASDWDVYLPKLVNRICDRIEELNH